VRKEVIGNATLYADFLAAKLIVDPSTGLKEIPTLNPMLFDFQRDIVRWALRRGRAAIFADCGMGKTPMQLEWARHIPGDVLILAPLAVSAQTVREGEKFGVPVGYARNDDQIKERITITNYEMLEHFDTARFSGIVLDESSILKAYDGKTRTAIIDGFAQTPFRLACTATPAPNDYMELGNHAQFIGAMSYTEMLSMFFVHDGGETQKWRLKGHAESEFWRWLCSWAVMIRKPSDLGYEDGAFKLPEMVVHDVTVKVDKPTSGMLFAIEAETLQERIAARRDTVCERVAHAAAIANATDKPFLVWCNLNSESEKLVKAIPGAVEVKGSDSVESKEKNLLAFSRGELRCMVTKPSIAGHGLNWQHCADMAFVGLSDSYEQFYQAVRRCWRFGQTHTVNVHVICAETEGAVVQNIKRKEREALQMAENMVEHMKDLNTEALHGAMVRSKSVYARDVKEGSGWKLHLADCVDVAEELADNSIGYSVYSPPFASLYTYSNSDRDMGNCKDDDEFMQAYTFLVRDLFRVTMPGRLTSFHCMNMPTSKVRDGVIGLKDFRGELIRIHIEAGWIYHSEVCIWKDPVTAMQRTKALGLLYKQIKKDSAMSRMGIPDYVVTMRKPGENPERVAHTPDDLPVSEWQKIASPIWMDINPSDTLQFRSAREHNDERHICPLQLEVIRRCMRLWSNPGDTVFSPFVGIGSEGFIALQMGRKFIGAELKRSYWEQACRNLEQAKKEQGGLFIEAT
jgi:superfamily II DNA or RNA helicase